MNIQDLILSLRYGKFNQTMLDNFTTEQLNSCDEYGNNLYHYFANVNFKSTIQELDLFLKKGLSPNLSFKSANYMLFDLPINYFLRHGKINEVKLLLKYNVDVNLKNDDGNNALMDFLKFRSHFTTNHLQIVDELIELTKNINEQNKWLETAFFFVSKF